MEMELIVKEIDEIQKKINLAFTNKDYENFISYYDDELRYTNADSSMVNKEEFIKKTKKLFERTKSIFTEYYRIKSSFDDDFFTEKVARKSKLNIKNLLLFSKKQTIQTEEIFHWKKFNEGWKVISVEIVLEEIY